MLRWTSFLVAAMVVLTLGIPATAQSDEQLPPGGTFVDDDGDVHEGYIEAIAADRITRGCDPPLNIRYCPDDVVTRGQMAAFLTRAFELAASDDDPFGDTAGSPFAEDIAALAAAEITKGCNPPQNNLFCPDDPVTRAQMAAFLRRALGLNTDPGSTFADDDGSEFEDDIAEMAAAGVAKGCNPPANTMFCPDDPVTRAQMASFLGRALHLTPVVPQERDAVFDGAAWSVTLPYADHPEETYGWISADFYDHGVAMMDLREYQTVDATVEERSIQVLEPVEGRWVPTVLMGEGSSNGESSPIDLAASGDRLAVAAYPPSVHIFTRTNAGWDEAVVSLASAIVGDEFNGAVALSGDRIAVTLDSNRYALVEYDGSQWVPEVFSMETTGTVLGLDRQHLAWGGGESLVVATEDQDGWTVRPLTPVVPGHNFGSSVDVDDGRVLVAANGATPGPGTSGAVYLYTPSGGAWVGEAVATGGDGFGDAARLDGHVVLCGGSHSDPGSIWVYEEIDSSWTGHRVVTGFDSWVGELALEGDMAVAIDFTGLLGPHTAVLFGVD